MSIFLCLCALNLITSAALGETPAKTVEEDSSPEIEEEEDDDDEDEEEEEEERWEKSANHMELEKSSVDDDYKATGYDDDDDVPLSGQESISREHGDEFASGEGEEDVDGDDSE
ncbi:unnamed protein product [Calicophoron daubneyi]|uniref:Uncharacterized protein n=1 Tax=Calicophoron daubneyi TaxID=300641 RepID=A0AAV2T2X3_CALDB